MDPIKLRGSAGPDVAGAPQKALPASQDPQEAARQFEALLIQEMLKSMWAAVPQGEMLSNSNEEKMYRDMLNEATADQVSRGQGIGVKDVILKDINRLDKKA